MNKLNKWLIDLKNIPNIYFYEKCLTHAGCSGHLQNFCDFLHSQSLSSAVQLHDEETRLRRTFDISLSLLVAYTTNFVLPLPQLWPWQFIPSDGATWNTAIAIAIRQKTLNILILFRTLFVWNDTTNSNRAREVNWFIGCKWQLFI